ncbi:MAG TPA: S-layer protein [Candidatus Norongarragalinales archaeon]|nr:S-layer protein [Candidatus Norongarragalinales archaeon]
MSIVKSLNVRKIATVAAGALMVGAAAAGAAVSADTAGLSAYRFYSANGAPDVKIVVGSTAAASDAIAAGNIAAWIGNAAYTNTNIPITGTDQLTCGGSGACNVTSESVTLTLTTPGIDPNVIFEMKTHIGNLLDNTPLDRTDNGGVSGTGYTDPGSPLITKARRISGDDTKLLFKGTLTDTVAGKSFTEETFMNLTGAAVYDPTTKTVIGRQLLALYFLQFTDPIPACTYDSNASNCNGVAAGTSGWQSNDNSITKHRFKISFLGDLWIVTDMSTSSGSINSITLGKEILYNPIMRVLTNVTDPSTGVTIQLADITGFGYGTGGTSVPRASFKFFDKNGVFLEQVTMDESSGNNEVSKYGVTLHVNKVFPGAFQKEAYADVSLYSQKLTLTNGQTVDTTDNIQWQVTLTNATGFGGTGFNVKTIQLQLLSSPQYKYAAGDFLPIIAKPANWRFTYKGVDSTVEYDTITINAPSTQPFAIDNSSNVITFTQAVQITNSRSGAWYIGGNAVGGNTVWFLSNGSDPGALGNGSYMMNGTGLNVTSASGGGASAVARWLYKDSSTAGYWRHTTSQPQYYSSSDEQNQPWYANATFSNTSGSGPRASLLIAENIAAIGTTGSPVWKNWSISFNLTQNPAIIESNFPSNNQASYNGSASGNGLFTSLQDVGLISDRGTTLLASSSSGVQLKYPRKVAQAVFSLGLSSTNASGASSRDQTLLEGQTADLGSGYTVRVKSIDETVSSGAGTSAGGVSGLDKLRATGASVVALDTASNALVITDVEASGVSKAIVVGGSIVNNLARDIIPGTSPSDWPQPVIKVSGGKILVAGWSAADTQEAVRSLLQWLRDNRDSVRATG